MIGRSVDLYSLAFPLIALTEGGIDFVEHPESIRFVGDASRADELIREGSYIHLHRGELLRVSHASGWEEERFGGFLSKWLRPRGARASEVRLEVTDALTFNEVQRRVLEGLEDELWEAIAIDSLIWIVKKSDSFEELLSGLRAYGYASE